jgi:thiamine biosynthesis lipoprotein
MGTWLEVSVGAKSEIEAAKDTEKALDAIFRAERRLSTWTDDSELARFNSSPVGDWVELSSELARDLGAAVKWHEITSGSFHPGLASLIEAWGLRSGIVRPSSHSLDGAIYAANLSHFQLDGNQARRLHPEFGIDEGGFAKGVALADALQAVTEASCVSMNFGGQIALSPGCKPTDVALSHPADRDTVVATLARITGSIATSSDSERLAKITDQRFGHIIDPRSGEPRHRPYSVTVFTSNPVHADVLATAFYVMGPEKAAYWLENHPEHSAVFIVETGENLEVMASSHLVPDIEVTTNRASIRPLPATSFAEGDTDFRAPHSTKNR